MHFNIYNKIIAFLVCTLSYISAFAGDLNALSAAVAKEHQLGTVFQQANFFTIIHGTKHTNVLHDETLLQPNKAIIDAVYESRPHAIAVKFTDSKGKTFVLEMMQSKPMADNANFGYITHQGRYQQRVDNGLHYQGAIAGTEKSLASMSIFADGSIMALFADADGNYVVGELEDKSGNYILYNDRDMLVKPAMPCEVRGEERAKPANTGVQGKTTAANMCRKVQLYWECDYQFFQNKVTLIAAQNHMTGLFNQVQTMYRNENISVELKSLYIWTVDDGYPSGTSSDGLDIFMGYWNGHNDGFDGDIAHLITMDASSNGGLAYLDVLDIGRRSIAYAYSEIHASYNTVPTYSWSVMVLSHETGHNMGSMHTHWCGWNTGAGGSCGSIDNCTTQESGSSCSTCPSTLSNAAPVGAWSGSIMSYCHLVARGIGFANGFTTLPGNLLRDNVTNTTNLKSVISAKLTPTNICTSNGAITLTYNTDNFGQPPYTYAWSNGGNTQSIGSISTAGTYTVTVTDANGCTNTFSADVAKLARPGNGKPTGYSLPVCCDKGPVTITLSADAPTDLQSCQTVAWLRTTTPIASYSAAQTAFGTATPANILYSTNSAAVTNTVAATLSITSPSPCANQSFYYTPFVTRKPKAANNITSTISNSGTVDQDFTTIGAYATIPNQLASATACDVLDTATTKTLSVTISSYTGRANRLSILVQNPTTGTVWYRADGLAGNGTYSIPLTNAPSLLDAMVIKAFDFNCSNSTTCVSSSLSISASRTVSYPAITTPRFEAVCQSGASTLLGFRPDSCISVGVSEVIPTAISDVSVYPNPATHTTVLRFNAESGGSSIIRILDVTGREIKTISLDYYTGENYLPISVSGWAKGVYFISLRSNTGDYLNTKLTVE
jgi:hypothetical protein